MLICAIILNAVVVAPRKGRVSRNVPARRLPAALRVAPRKGRVSRNCRLVLFIFVKFVAPRKGRVSRKIDSADRHADGARRAPQGACE